MVVMMRIMKMLIMLKMTIMIKKKRKTIKNQD